jgi:hypothetical protein
VHVLVCCAPPHVNLHVPLCLCACVCVLHMATLVHLAVFIWTTGVVVVQTVENFR